MQTNEVTTVDLSLDWDSAFSSGSSLEAIHVDSIPDALILSLSNLGRVDIEYIMDITGEDYMTIINALKGSIYQNPDTWNSTSQRARKNKHILTTASVIYRIFNSKRYI